MNEQERLNWAYVGIDIHKASHTAVILSPFGDRLGSRTLSNLPEAFPAFLQEVRALAGRRRLRFGLENTSTWGRGLAQYLVAAGEPVHLVTPLRTDREGLVKERTRVKNRLHQLLPYAHPAYAAYFGDPFGKTALAFWKKLSEGKSKKAALTSLMRVLVRVVWRMLKEQAPYEKKVQAGNK